MLNVTKEQTNFAIFHLHCDVCGCELVGKGVTYINSLKDFVTEHKCDCGHAWLIKESFPLQARDTKATVEHIDRVVSQAVKNG